MNETQHDLETTRIDEVEQKIQALNELLRDAKSDFESDSHEFKKSNIFKMGRYISLMGSLLSLFKIRMVDELSECLEDLADNSELLKKFNLKQFKQDWNHFLTLVENSSLNEVILMLYLYLAIYFKVLFKIFF